MTNAAIKVPFHGANLFVVSHNGEPFVPMKPIVEGMGMAWQTQHRKLTERFSKGITEMVIPSVGGKQVMTCLALRKLNGWLQTISPNKVKPEIRDKVIQYQNECDDVLYEYWTTGEVKRKAKTSVDERTPLRDAVNLLVSKKHLMYPEAYAIIHQRFNVQSIEELDSEQIPVAVEYVHKLVLEGEFIGKADAIGSKTKRYNFPAETADPHDRTVGNAWMTPRVILDERNRAPELELLEALHLDGYDITGAKIRIHAMYGIVKQFIKMQNELSLARRHLSVVNDIIKNQTVQRGSNVSFSGSDIGVAYGGHPKRSLA
ncbi:phage antirepressor N-terminal domain-containing protein [Serratia marcescens]|uniref:Antirepressor protein Ant n=1 Tax=Serratia marcescens TaxID=615 RepID=A0A9X8VHC4_SERMA|nr:phage antirepressor N-terminal domain-containing protein [Serratia marcescens]MBS3895106.1 phage antirepressor N-terminal domain-containing protein [Serratia marcescens]